MACVSRWDGLLLWVAWAQSRTPLALLHSPLLPRPLAEPVPLLCEACLAQPLAGASHQGPAPRDKASSPCSGLPVPAGARLLSRVLREGGSWAFWAVGLDPRAPEAPGRPVSPPSPGGLQGPCGHRKQGPA